MPCHAVGDLQERIREGSVHLGAYGMPPIYLYVKPGNPHNTSNFGVHNGIHAKEKWP